MTITKATETKINELVDVLTDTTNIPAGFYTESFSITSTSFIAWETNKEGFSLFQLLNDSSQTAECFLYIAEHDIYYFSVWIPALHGYMLTGPYHTTDDSPGKELLQLDVNVSRSTGDISVISKHHHVITISNSLIRHYFYYYPGFLREYDWMTADIFQAEVENVEYPYEQERKFLEYFKSADPESYTMLQVMEEDSSITFGSTDSIRHSKNKLIVLETILVRAMIESGVAASEALRISNGFLFTIEKTSNLTDLHELQRKIFDAFYFLIHQHCNTHHSPFVQKIRDFIQRHLREPLDVRAVADYMNISKGHLSTQFKKECGVTLKHYILERKIEEAKRLILFTEHTLSGIAALLCFNDQTYFTKAFKRITGQTPLQYQKKSYSGRRKN
ncbi:helix-turn-helix domain-containing protein [Salibacterium halotolerans]|uniref:AraC-type DNA-binding protein n=1 Tax=Salibacterium halotolerans TaxID=1884432 RepID=A0A1I5L056_9BACI|nr:helix-turn-helix domain-containing protein [Salibacterium halotolerans]SFO90111.1 AraC-type DNA-binding protein [Salibacterium halotolerans]